MSGYGFCADDPIRVSGFYEEKRYLECLRKAGGNAPFIYERLGSCCSEDTGHPVDVYRIGAKGLFRRPVLLYIDIYGERDWRPPKGYFLNAPAPPAGEGGRQREDAENLFQAIYAVPMQVGGSHTGSDSSVKRNEK